MGGTAVTLFTLSSLPAILVETMKQLVRFLDRQPTWLMVLVSFFLLLLGWDLLVAWGAYDRFILPAR